MRLLVTICLIVVLFDLVGLVWSAADEKPHEAFVAMNTPPARAMQDPKTNSYYLMVGFGVPASLHPLQAGYEMWLEADQGDRYFDYAKDTRSQARLDHDVVLTVSSWRITDLLNPADRLKLRADQPDELLQARYQQWLTMPFEDRGYGLRGNIRLAELFVEHRRYLAGAAPSDLAGMLERLELDVAAWRTVMAEARTLPMKVLASVVVDDDAALLSEFLKRPDLPKPLLHRVSLIARPLNYFEQSLRYPMQSEFVVGARRYARVQVEDPAALQEDRDNLHWLSGLARLSADAFQRVGLRPSNSRVARFFLQKQRTLNIYAKYYDAAIKVSDTSDGPMPKLSDFARTAPRSFVDYLMAPAIGPLDTLLGSGGDPVWEPFMSKIRETDARLRLTGLQAMLRMPSPQSVPIRVAMVGTAFYDPFSGIPMLWNAEKGVLYSVGRDGLDDGGDSQLDVTVTLLQPEPAPAAGRAARPRQPAR